MTSSGHTACRRAIGEHFEARISPAREQQMRRHLAECATCREHYELHLALAEIDPKGRPAKERLAVGLGLGPGRPASRLVPAAATLALGTAAFLFVFRFAPLAVAPSGDAAVPLDSATDLAQPSSDSRTSQTEFRGRGLVSPGTSGHQTALWVYRMLSSTASEPVGKQLVENDELAFAYQNEQNWPYLMVFAVDEHGHVYWYYPAWTDPMQNPRSIPIGPGTDLKELPDAVRHRYDGSRVRLVGLFSQTALSVRDVEERIESADSQGEEFSVPDTFQWEHYVDVKGP